MLKLSPFFYKTVRVPQNIKMAGLNIAFLTKIALCHCSSDLQAGLEITAGHWPFSDQLSLFGRANPIC